MNNYEGRRKNNEVLANGLPLNPAPSQKLRYHSPDGFNWGYAGSGPAQLALAILLHHAGKEVALFLYQSFKWEFVSRWEDNWRITGAEIDEWTQKQFDHAEKGD
ncbi:MAG: hypothetical protein HY890_01570 [Deltaproteobacteria bacterium]|nr:hypothetical protein [Deltaproteobacteria bacterium]